MDPTLYFLSNHPKGKSLANVENQMQITKTEDNIRKSNQFFLKK